MGEVGCQVLGFGLVQRHAGTGAQPAESKHHSQKPEPLKPWMSHLSDHAVFVGHRRSNFNDLSL